MPKLSNQSNHLYYILIILCLIIIIMLGFLIYFIMNKKNQIYNVDNQKKYIDKQTIVIEKQKDDIPVYPKNLPQYDNKQYQQIGILTANEDDKEPIILPLFAKKLKNNRDRWQYYTATDKNNMMRLPIVHDNMKCDDDIGCKEIYDGDKLYIEIYKGRVFTATIYKIESPNYFADVY